MSYDTRLVRDPDDDFPERSLIEALVGSQRVIKGKHAVNHRAQLELLKRATHGFKCPAWTSRNAAQDRLLPDE
jgi:hypothetical protein